MFRLNAITLMCEELVYIGYNSKQGITWQRLLQSCLGDFVNKYNGSPKELDYIFGYPVKSVNDYITIN
jgi:hypothetical protein